MQIPSPDNAPPAAAPPSRPTASVIIVAYNGMAWLPGCLAALAAQLRPGDEVIVVDNRSGDGGPQFIRQRFPTVRLVENQGNAGFAAACNQGAALARGDVLVFLNQDTAVQPGWLDGLLAGLGAGPGVGLSTSRLLLMAEPERIQMCGQDVHYTGLVFARDFGRPADSRPHPCDVDAVSGASFAIGRALWERLGGFDERLFMYYEETDLSWRARGAGYRCRYAPDSVALHDYRSSTPSEGRLYYTFRNRTLLLFKSWRAATLLLLAPALLLAELLEWGQALSRGRQGLRAKLRAGWWLVAQRDQVRWMRAAALAQRRVSDGALLAAMTATVDPVEGDYGPVARALVAAADRLFRLNRRVALWLLRDRRAASPPEREGARP